MMFLDELKDFRKRYGLSLSDIEELTGVSRLTVFNWEHKLTVPNAKQKEIVREVMQQYTDLTPDACREYREKYNVSRGVLASYIGVSNITVMNFEKDSVPMRLKTKLQAMKFFAAAEKNKIRFKMMLAAVIEKHSKEDLQARLSLSDNVMGRICKGYYPPKQVFDSIKEIYKNEFKDVFFIEKS